MFDWHARPGVFERLSPPWQPVRVLARTGPPLEPGSRLDLEVKVGPLWQRWVAEHGAWSPGAMFSDRQAEGPFAAWEHWHRFEDEGSGTRLEDEVHYVLPLGALGRVAAGYAARQLDRMFAYRHRVTATDLAWHARYGGAPMHILMTGSSGMIGSALRAFLGGGGHHVRRLLRAPSREPGTTWWNPIEGSFADGAFEGIEAVVHLAGVSIGARRWSAARKQAIYGSRVVATRHLAEALARLAAPPKVLVAASAMGFYGDRGEALVDESSRPGKGFLSEVCQAWEAATAPARDAGMRVVHLRTGIVLSPAGGALPRMLTPFRLGLGGVLGSGDQYMSWIALDDVLGVVLHALTQDAVSGPVNVATPHPVTNREFTRTLGTVLRRPTIVPVPAPAIRLMFGERGEKLLLEGARLDPAVLRATDYRFAYPELEGALRHVLGR